MRTFRQLNSNPETNPAQTIAGLRQVVLMVWASQIVLTLMAAIIARFVLEPRAALGFTQGFALVSLLLYLGVNAFVTLSVARSKSFVAVFQGCILLGTISTVPGVLACVLIALEGVRAGAFVLGFASLILLASSLTRIPGFVAQIKAVKLETEDQTFTGFGSSSEFERPDWAAQYGSAQYGSAQYGSAQYGSGQYGSGQYGSGQQASTQQASTQTETDQTR